MKYNEKLHAIELRKQGKSYGEIRQKVKVSKGTLSVWLKDVILTTDQKIRLYVTTKQLNGYKAAKTKQAKKAIQIFKVTTAAKHQTKKFIKNPLFLCGVMLYWAEGDKSENEEVKFSNSDPRMIILMMKWFREIAQVPEEKFRIALHIHELHNQIEIEDYWSKITNVPHKKFHKTQVKPTSIGHRKKHLYNGTCSIRIGDKNLFRKLQGWKIGILENLMPEAKNELLLTNIYEKPEWLKQKEK